MKSINKLDIIYHLTSQSCQGTTCGLVLVEEDFIKAGWQGLKMQMQIEYKEDVIPFLKSCKLKGDSWRHIECMCQLIACILQCMFALLYATLMQLIIIRNVFQDMQHYVFYMDGDCTMPCKNIKHVKCCLRWSCT